MAVVQGIREKVHLPLYDSVSVDGEKQISDVEKSGTLKFFVNVQGKTKLETNLQSASLLPHYNTFEARAMRVVISDLPPKFPAEETAKDDGFDVTDDDGLNFVPAAAGSTTPVDKTAASAGVFTASVELGIDRLVDLYREAKANVDDQSADLDVDDEDVDIIAPDGTTASDAIVLAIADAGGAVTLSVGDIEDLIDTLDKKAPLKEQIDPNNGSGTVIGKIVYNTVTTLFVGEKQMISMPTWFFPAGAGPYSETGKFTTHGEPTPNATFRFAEPIYIDKQQNFRVEIEIPESDTVKEIQRIYGPLNIWVVLDGFMTRDVQ